MAKGTRKKSQVAQKVQDYVTVFLAESEDQAKEYEALLSSDDIPVTIKKHSGSEQDSRGFAVMVPEDYADEAYVIIESQDAYDDFYDLAIEDDMDFDDEVFDEDL